MPNIWATFVRIFVAKNFQKSPNLVMLYVTDSRFAVKCEPAFEEQKEEGRENAAVKMKVNQTLDLILLSPRNRRSSQNSLLT